MNEATEQKNILALINNPFENHCIWLKNCVWAANQYKESIPRHIHYIFIDITVFKKQQIIGVFYNNHNNSYCNFLFLLYWSILPHNDSRLESILVTMQSNFLISSSPVYYIVPESSQI